MQFYKQTIVVALISLLASRGVDAEGYMRPAPRPAPVAPSTGSVYDSAPLDEYEAPGSEIGSGGGAPSSAGSIEGSDEFEAPGSGGSAPSSDGSIEGDDESEAPDSELGSGSSAPSSSGSVEGDNEPVQVVDVSEDTVASGAAPEGPTVGGAPSAAIPKPGKARKCKSKRVKGPSASVGSGLGTVPSVATSEPEVISDPEPGYGSSAAEPKAVLSAPDSGADAPEEADSEVSLSSQSPSSASDSAPAEVNSEGSLSNQGFSPAEASDSGSEEASSNGSLSYKRPTSAEAPAEAEESSGEQASTADVEPEMEGNTDEVLYKRPQSNGSESTGSAQVTSEDEAAGIGYKRPVSPASHKTVYETE